MVSKYYHTKKYQYHTSFFLFSIAKSHISITSHNGSTTHWHNKETTRSHHFYFYLYPYSFYSYSYRYYQINQSITQSTKHVTQHRLPHRIQDNVTGIAQDKDDTRLFSWLFYSHLTSLSPLSYGTLLHLLVPGPKRTSVIHMLV